MPSRYNLARARGGKDDAAIEEALKDKWDALRRQDKITTIVESLRRPHWEGQDRVDIQADHAVFLDRNDNTFSPVAIKAAVRVLHKHGFRGLFWIKVSGDKLCIQPLAMCKRGTVLISSLSRESSSGWVSNVESLWSSVLVNPVSLFRTTVDDPLLAVFDEKDSSYPSKRNRYMIESKICPTFMLQGLSQKMLITLGFPTNMVEDGNVLMPIILVD